MSKRDKKQEDNFFLNLGNLPPVDLSEADRALFGELESLTSLTPEQAIVAKQNGVVEIGPFRMTPVGLEITDAVTDDQWKNFFTAVQRIVSSMQWIIGDWMVYGELRLNKTYADVAAITGMAEATLKDYAYVARNVPMSVRTDALTFGHHKLIASLPEPQQKSWMLYAADRGLSISAMRKELDDTPTPPTLDPTGYKGFSKKARTVSQKIAAVGKGKRLSKQERAEVLGYIETMRQWLDAAEHLIND